MDLYAYVKDDPLNATDPTGEIDCVDSACNSARISSLVPTDYSGLYSLYASNGSECDNCISVTFQNDTPGGPSTDHAIQTGTAIMVENALRASGVSSANINSTTGGTHQAKPPSAHGVGRAVDVNRVNGDRVSSSNKGASALQDALSAQPNNRENLGPFKMEGSHEPGTPPRTINDQNTIAEHDNHIHAASQPNPALNCVNNNGETSCH
jgi:hypothetical protein